MESAFPPLASMFEVKQTKAFSVVQVGKGKNRIRRRRAPLKCNTIVASAQAICSDANKCRFNDDGFVVSNELVSLEACQAVCEELDCILRGELVGDCRPDKCPKGSVSCRTPSKKVLHLINTWKSSDTIKAVVTNPALGKLVAELGGWKGARVAEDQVWVKPPGSGPLVFHRDSPYFDFDPADVITVWIGD